MYRASVVGERFTSRRLITTSWTDLTWHCELIWARIGRDQTSGTW